MQAGMNDFLTKPFEPVALIGIVRRYLDINTQGLEKVKVALNGTATHQSHHHLLT